MKISWDEGGIEAAVKVLGVRLKWILDHLHSRYRSLIRTVAATYIALTGEKI